MIHSGREFAILLVGFGVGAALSFVVLVVRSAIDLVLRVAGYTGFLLWVYLPLVKGQKELLLKFFKRLPFRVFRELGSIGSVWASSCKIGNKSWRPYFSYTLHGGEKEGS